MNTFYVAIPDIGDSELFVTVSNLFEECDYPDSIFVGLAHSIPFKNKHMIDKIQKKFSKFSNISHCFIDSFKSRGVSFGRRAAISKYKGQDFYLQLDSHTMFEKSWDTKLIEIYNNASKKFKSYNILLTAYLPPYHYQSINNRVFSRGKKGAYPHYVSGAEVKNGMNPQEVYSWKKAHPEIPMWMMPNMDHNKHYSFIKDNYVLSRKLCANFLMAPGKFASEFDKILPTDIFFFEEEYIMSIEALSLGYNFVYPNVELPLAHLYTDEFNEFYTGRPSAEYEKKSYDITRKNFLNYLHVSEDKIKKYAEYAGLEYPSMNSLGKNFIPKEKTL